MQGEHGHLGMLAAGAEYFANSAASTLTSDATYSTAASGTSSA